MNRTSRSLGSGLMSAVCALVAGVAVAAAPSEGAQAGTGCPQECYVVTPAANPVTAGAGTGEEYAFRVTNNDQHESLRSLTFTGPADFVITGASGPAGTSVSALPGSSVTLHLPSEAPGSTFTVHVTALAPCVAASPQAWGLSGADSLGETSEVGWRSSPLSVSVTGKCSLAFTRQPAQTAVNSDIRTGFNSAGSPLAVQLLDASKDPLNPADVSAGPTRVSVSIQANPGGGTLSGTTTVVSSKGVADFGDLRISKAGVAYDLAADAPGFTPATSSLFTISGQIQACATGSCTASQATSTTAASVTAPSTSSGFVTLGLGGVSLTCAHYDAVSDVAAFDVVSSSGTSVGSSPAIGTLTTPQAVAQSVHRPLWRWHVCYGSQTPFPAIPGTRGTTVIGGITYYTGLLLPCFLFRSDHPEPCLDSRQRTWTGAVTLTFVILGDPLFHD